MTVTETSPGETTRESLGCTARGFSAGKGGTGHHGQGSRAWALENSTPEEGSVLGSTQDERAASLSPNADTSYFPGQILIPNVLRCPSFEGATVTARMGLTINGRDENHHQDPQTHTRNRHTVSPVLGRQLSYPPASRTEKGTIDPYQESIVYNL